MLLVAGLSLKNLKPRIWDTSSSYYLPNLQAVMVSYADFHQMPARRRAAMEQGLRKYLDVPKHMKVYLDNGAFYFLGRDGETPRKEYEEFVTQARPDWWPIPQDFIPTPMVTTRAQKRCFTRTMNVNLTYQRDGYTPVIHISRFLKKYTEAIQARKKLSAKPAIALGGIVPNLLRAPKAMSYEKILHNLQYVRQTFKGKKIHVFGIGGTATLHLAALLGMDSVDSSGWRNRAARGIVQLPGCGDRMMADLGSWSGRRPNRQEMKKLKECECPACQRYGIRGLKANKIKGFCNRATHNLWTLLKETRWIEDRLVDGTYAEWYKEHLNNSIYRPLIDQAVEMSKP